LPVSTTNQIVNHQYYSLSYEEYEQAEWVAYELKSSYVKTIISNAFFIKDIKVKTGSADWRNYKSHLLIKDIFVQRVIWNLM
jgi:endonuclease G